MNDPLRLVNDPFRLMNDPFRLVNDPLRLVNDPLTDRQTDRKRLFDPNTCDVIMRIE